ncbi:MAG: peptidylprolyl isomerase, partial [Alphaproteobacteria bacterium]
MMRKWRAAGLAALAGLALLAPALAPLPAAAQGTFSPAIRIDNDVVTKYEINQRVAFLTALRAPGDVRALARDQLINETLQLRLADQAGVTVDEAALKAGMEEFAARGKLTAEQFIQLLGQAGIAAETFRDFVRAGIAWREYVRQELLPKVSLSDAEIDAAMAEATPTPGERVLLSEIVLPGADPASRKASLARAKRLAGLDEKGFAEAAMRFSTGPSRNKGGKLKWLDPATLPASAIGPVRRLRPGQMTGPIVDGDTVRLYFLHDREKIPSAKPRPMVDYAALLLPGGRSPANLAEA